MAFSPGVDPGLKLGVCKLTHKYRMSDRIQSPEPGQSRPLPCRDNPRHPEPRVNLNSLEDRASLRLLSSDLTLACLNNRCTNLQLHHCQELSSSNKMCPGLWIVEMIRRG